MMAKLFSLSQLLTAALVASGGAFIARWISWRSHNQHLVEMLLTLDEADVLSFTPEQQQNLFDKLPPVVKGYFSKVLPTTDTSALRKIKSLHMAQNGTILLGDSWLQFTALQEMSATHENVGFLWDATVLLPIQTPPLIGEFPYKFAIPVAVRDAFVKGVGDLDARMLRIVSLAHIEDNPDINEGELMRWLAEACLIPTTLLPSNLLSWKAVEGNEKQAKLHFDDRHSSNTKADLLITFDHDNLMRKMTGIRAKTVGDKTVHAKWEGRIIEYATHENMKVPRLMEAGWYEDKKFNPYWKGENTIFNFTFL